MAVCKMLENRLIYPPPPPDFEHRVIKIPILKF